MSAAGFKHAGGRIGYWAAVLVMPTPLVVLYGAHFVRTGPTKSDFWTFWHASRVVLHAGNPYPAIASLPAVADKWFAPFVYPPVAAFLLAPVGVLPFAVAKVVFFLLNIGCLVAALRLLDVRDWRCYTVACASPAVLEAAGIGTISLPLLLVVACAWRYRSRAVACGLCVAAAVTAKLFLWPLWFWLVRTRRWAAAAVAVFVSLVAVVAAWAAIGWQGLRDYPTLIGRMTGLEGPHSYSVYALQRVFGVGDGPAARVSTVLGLIALVLALWFVRDERRSLIALLGVALLATPILWPHYLVLLFAPIALASSSLSRLWFAPVLLWADATAWAHGHAWRIVGELVFVAVVLGAASRRPLPQGQRATFGTKRLRSSECRRPTGATGSVEYNGETPALVTGS